MTDEISLAFAHPDARSRASAGAGPLDRISLRDHIVEVEIGAFQQERGTTQRIAFNVVVEVLPAGARIDDDVDRILSYDKVTEAIATELAAERLNLLETLAERIAERILLEPQAERVFVRIEKLDRGPGALGVEIVRGKGDPVHFSAPVTADEVPHPVVLYLSNPAIASPHLSSWLDQLEGGDRPLLICVGPSETPAPQTGHAMTQRRIDLLAIEQNAWVLAARDLRCVVVETRTEFDWAMKQWRAGKGQVSVWAPSKMVLDAVDKPSVKGADALALALWFAGQMHAAEFIAVGAEAPGAENGFPCRHVNPENAKL